MKRVGEWYYNKVIKDSQPLSKPVIGLLHIYSYISLVGVMALTTWELFGAAIYLLTSGLVAYTGAIHSELRHRIQELEED